MSTQTDLAELYTMFFNRAPDATGLAYWVNEISTGQLSLGQIAQNWNTQQPEGLANFPSTLTDAQFIEKIYGNMLGRASDTEGAQYWLNELANGTVTRDTFPVTLINGAKANTSAQSLIDTALITNKATVGVAFADKGLNDTTLAAKVLTSVSADASSVSGTQAIISLIPSAAADQNSAVLASATQLLTNLANLVATAPGEVADASIYLQTLVSGATATTNLLTLLDNASTLLTTAATNPAALDNPAAQGATAVVVATPSTGGGTPVVVTVISEEGRDTIALTSAAEKVVVAGGTAGTTESNTFIFGALTLGQSVTLAGKTLVATGAISAIEVAGAFSVDATKPDNGTLTGAYSDWAAGAATGTGVTFISTTENSDVTNLPAAVVAGTNVVAPALPAATSQQGVAAVTESSVFTFGALIAGQSVTLAGKTLVATGAISAIEVAGAFSLDATKPDNGTLTGAYSDWAAGTATGTGVTFTSTTLNSNVTDLTASVLGSTVAAPATPTASVVQNSAAAVTETSAITFGDLIAGQSVTVAGKTLTATAAVSAADVASAFTSNLAPSGSSLSGGLSGWTAGTTVTGSTVTFTSTVANTDVANLAATAQGSIVAAPTALTPSTIQGDDIELVTETTEFTFGVLIAGQSVEVAGKTLLASGNISAAEVALAFSSAETVPSNGTLSGTFNGWTANTATGTAVMFTSAIPASNVSDLLANVAGSTVVTPTVPTAVPVQGSAGASEISSITFVALTSGQSVTVAGKTLLATGAISAADVAAAFSSDTAPANSTLSGTFSEWTAGAVSGTSVTFTSNTANTDVPDLAATVAGSTIPAPVVPTGTANQGVVGVTETNAFTFVDLVAGQSVTVAGKTLTATGDISADDVAAAFSVNATEPTDGTLSGTFSGWISGVSTDANVTFTSTTANANVTDLIVSAEGTNVLAPTALTSTSVQGSATVASASAANLTDHDIITGFSLSADKLDLPATALLTGTFDATQTGITNLEIGSITNGVVTFGGTETSFESKFTALLNAMETNKSAAAFVVAGDTYVVQGDGVAGVQNSDILIKLTGVAVTDLGAIIV